MRDYKIEATHSSSERSDSFRDWFRGYHVPDRDQQQQHRNPHDLSRIGRTGRVAWLDCDRAWYSYRVAATTVHCGFVGIYIGLILNHLMGVG